MRKTIAAVSAMIILFLLMFSVVVSVGNSKYREGQANPTPQTRSELYFAGQMEGIEIGREDGFLSGQAAGLEQAKDALEKGYEIGLRKGQDIGYRKGYQLGYRQGENSGLKQAEKLCAPQVGP